MPDEWFYVKDKKKVGPVAFAQLQQLAATGQLLANDMVLQGGTARWQAASAVAGLFAAPAPQSVQPVQAVQANPFAASPDPFAPTAPVAPPEPEPDPFTEAAPSGPADLEAFADATSNERMKPHQGGLIIGLGITSIVAGLLGVFGMCPYLYPFLVCSLVAAGTGLPIWFKGGSDLRLMRRGLMDQEGEGSTRSGRVCGLVGAIIGILELAVAVAVILFIKIVELSSK